MKFNVSQLGSLMACTSHLKLGLVADWYRFQRIVSKELLSCQTWTPLAIRHEIKCMWDGNGSIPHMEQPLPVQEYKTAYSKSVLSLQVCTELCFKTKMLLGLINGKMAFLLNHGFYDFIPRTWKNLFLPKNRKRSIQNQIILTRTVFQSEMLPWLVNGKMNFSSITVFYCLIYL